MKNTQIRLAVRPVGLPKASDWQLVTEETPALQEGQFLVRNLYISLDPAMRGWVRDVPSYLPPVGIGEVMRAGTVGKVIASKNAQFPEGTYVSGMGGVQTHLVTDGRGFFPVVPKVPLPMFLSVLGMTGFTAYFGFLHVGTPKEGDTVLVSGGAGAVGSVVGQIAKLKGCRVVGIAGGAEKCQYMKDELGYDGVIDYKTEKLSDGMKRECPKGIDVYFDNVGGETLNTALRYINMKARVVICGAISQYNDEAPSAGPANYLNLLVKRARMEGFIVFDFAKDYGTAAREMGQWLAEGKLKTKEHIEKGIENFPEVLVKLFTGENKGKLILQVAEESEM